MKLLYCPACGDLFNLTFVEKQCACGKSRGQYLQDGLNAEFSGGVPIALHNGEFLAAIQEQKLADPAQLLAYKDSFGKRFGAWVVPANSTTFRNKKLKRGKKNEQNR